MTLTTQTKVEEEQQRYYHTFEFPDGEVIKGVWDHRPIMSNYEKIEDVEGKTLLDAGCRDGFFSWYFENRKAKVTGLDIIDRPLRRLLAKKLGTKFPFLHLNILELVQRPANEFDIVFCSDVVQHLESPLAALRALHHVCRERLVLVVDLHDELEDKAIMTEDMFVPMLWGSLFVLKMITMAGFKNARRLAKFQVGGTVYPTRDVGIFTADADPGFSLESMINGPLWASTCLCDLSKTHRYEADISGAK